MTPCAALAFPGAHAMPPLFAHDPLAAAQQAAQPRWLLAPATAVSVACEYWVLALVALAVYAWLEADVRSVLKVWGPLLLGLAAGVGVVALSGRAVAAAGWGVRGLPSGHALWGATFAAYTWRVYGRKAGLLAALLPVAGGGARMVLGSHGLGAVALGWGLGVLLGVGAWAVAARIAPGRFAGRRRGERKQPAETTGAT